MENEWRSIAEELTDVQRRLADLLGVPAPIKPMEPDMEISDIADLAQEADALHDVASRMRQALEQIQRRIEDIEAQLHGRHPTH